MKQWHFEYSRGGWNWLAAETQPQRLDVSKHRFASLEACIADAQKHGYVPEGLTTVARSDVERGSLNMLGAGYRHARGEVIAPR